jgi:NodT family efflux transporter outer membrane factor (OMF) lipoprotein
MQVGVLGVRATARLRVAALATAMFSALAGCAVGPSFEAPEANLPEQWNASAASDASLASRADVAAPVESQWWTRFGDPVLVRLIEDARQDNLDLRVAALRVAQVRTQRDAIAGGRLPAVAARAGYQRQRVSEFGSSTRLIDAIGIPGSRDAIIDVLSEPHDVFQAGFDASWELDFWGRLRRSVESGNASLAASGEAFLAAELALSAEVARTYFQLRGIQEQVRAAQGDVDASEDALELTRLLADKGALSQLEVSSLRAQLADSRSRLAQLEPAQTQLLNALAFLVAKEPAALDAQLTEARAAPAPPETVGLGVPSELARRRPDIRGAEARLHAATADIGVAVADLYPRITLTGGFMQEALSAGDLAEWGARQWQIGPSLYLPLFDGGRRRAVVELRKLQQQEAALHYQRTVLQAWHEIENALSAYAAEQRRATELEQAVAAARDAHELATLRYEHGMTNFLVALDTQRTLLRSQLAYAESAAAVSTRLVALYKALGGGWE